MAESAAPPPRLRILCLHGMGTSAAILTRQLRPLADACGDVAEFVHLNGQDACPAVRWEGAARCAAGHAAEACGVFAQADAVIEKVFPGGPVRLRRADFFSSHVASLTLAHGISISAT